MNQFKAAADRKIDWLLAAGAGVIAAIVYFSTCASYVFPGQSAHLVSMWRGLDSSSAATYPLMSVFAKALGGFNLIAPVCGVLSAMLLYALVRFFVRDRVRGETTSAFDLQIARIAAFVAALVYVFTPAVHEAATHVEPRLFDFMWLLAAFALIIPMARASKALKPLYTLLAAVMFGLGTCDSALFFVMGPVFLVMTVIVSVRRSEKPYLAATAFVLLAFIAYLSAIKLFGLELSGSLRTMAREVKGWFVSGWLFVVIFSVVPFVTSIFSSAKAYNEKQSFVQSVFHIAMTLVAIIAIATPFSPSSQMAPWGVLPVVTSAFAAVVAGYAASYWWICRKTPVGIVSGGILAFVVSVTCVWNIFLFDTDRGAFADKVARKIIKDLDGRRWFVTDGTLDDHILIAAADMKRDIELISLNRDLDTKYLESLSQVVKERNVGGSKNESLRLSLTLGVLPFVQDWFAADPTVVKEVAIFGASDLWYSSGLKPVPEFFFFGADETRKVDWSAWKDFDALLKAPDGWGSYSHRRERDPLKRLRLHLRRHLGLVANNRGVYFQDMKRDDEAFAMYELVLNEIDRDNICSLFNEIEMAGAKYAPALEKKRDLERRLKTVLDDKDRRYHIWRLGNYYGYIRNPEIFVRLGCTWARSGRPGDALSHIRRAIDFVPTDKRTILMNMMAALYASDNDQKKSRRIYEAVLEKNSNDHDALIGLMRIELLEGDGKKALEYLERAAASGGDTHRAKIELAMVAMMKNDVKGAKEMLRKATDENPKDMQAWSLLAAVTMQQLDAAKDAKVKAALVKELKNAILPKMEKQSSGAFDYYLQTTKAFMLMREGEDRRREARDAFVAAAKARPDIAATHDLVLGLDISLNDKIEAERHARDVLRRNRSAPLANYVMGSLALGKNRYSEAEAYLRKAADASKPVALALNDLAEVLRRNKNYVEAEAYARRAVVAAPKLYVAWETLGSILLDRRENKAKLKEAETCIEKALELLKSVEGATEDVRILISLARVQMLNGDMARARGTVRKVQGRVSELSDFERREFEEVKKGVR